MHLTKPTICRWATHLRAKETTITFGVRISVQSGPATFWCLPGNIAKYPDVRVVVPASHSADGRMSRSMRLGSLRRVAKDCDRSREAVMVMAVKGDDAVHITTQGSLLVEHYSAHLASEGRWPAESYGVNPGRLLKATVGLSDGLGMSAAKPLEPFVLTPAGEDIAEASDVAVLMPMRLD